MSDDVVDLAHRRRLLKAMAKTLWECTDCGSSEFSLTVDGDVLCAGCLDLITDLRTHDPETEEVVPRDDDG